MIKCRATDVKRMLDEIAEETSMALVRGNFPRIHEKLNDKYKQLQGESLPFGGDYLYRSLYKYVKNGVDKNQKLSLSPANMEALARVLLYDDYVHFEKRNHPAVSPLLKKCEGVWYSYVRCNSGKPFVLRAPVVIYPEKKSMLMKLAGPVRTFHGALTVDGNCMYCLLESNQGKSLYLVLKTGLSSEPNVIQGVFAGLSTAGDPIAGREVLIRQDKKITELTPERISIAELWKSASKEARILARYFETKEDTILKAGLSSTFELEDLVKVR